MTLDHHKAPPPALDTGLADSQYNVSLSPARVLLQHYFSMVKRSCRSNCQELAKSALLRLLVILHTDSVPTPGEVFTTYDAK